MSSRGHRVMSLAGEDFRKRSNQDIVSQFNEILDGGVHGMCFSPYLEGQGPGDKISEEQIRESLEGVRLPLASWLLS